MPYYFREWRKRAGLTQAQLAYILGVARPTVGRIETDDRDFTGDYLKNFAFVVECAVEDPLTKAVSFVGAEKATPEWIEAKRQVIKSIKELRKLERAEKEKNGKPRGKRPARARRKKRPQHK